MMWVKDSEALAARLSLSLHVDESTYRTWRLYMAGSANWFARGYLGVFQVLLAKPERGASGLPLTRGDWYMPS